MAKKTKEVKPIPLPVALLCAVVIFALMAVFIVYLSSPYRTPEQPSSATIDEGSFAEPTPDEPEQSLPVEVKEYMSDANIGDAVLYGRYEQNAVTDDGAEPVEWIVLDKNESGLLLISRYCLDCKAYNEVRSNVSYAESSLNGWLNGEFLNTAFTATEQEYILASDDNEKVFILSAEDAVNYYEYDSWRKTIATEYAIANGVKAKDGVAMWWLSDINPESSNAQYVYYDGAIAQKGFAVDYNVLGVRPVIWVSANAEREDAE